MHVVRRGWGREVCESAMVGFLKIEGQERETNLKQKTWQTLRGGAGLGNLPGATLIALACWLPCVTFGAAVTKPGIRSAWTWEQIWKQQK